MMYIFALLCPLFISFMGCVLTQDARPLPDFDFLNAPLRRLDTSQPRRTVEVSQQLHRPRFDGPADRDEYFDTADFDDVDVSSPDNWSLWTEWSFCSRTCGGGVSMRSRDCGASSPNDIMGKHCAGQSIQYMICNVEPCPNTDDDFRAAQCAEHDGNAAFGGTTRIAWEPYYGNNARPCELSCIAVGMNFYNNFGLARDGTRCFQDRYDMCVDGKCMKVGCDRILGSNRTEDACGVCGGDNTSCRHIRRVYDRLSPATIDYDYNPIVMIPKGATHIQVKDTTRNYIALMEATGEFVKYVINGNWVISWPGDFPVAGTIVRYERTENMELFSALGPTTADMHVMMLYLGGRPMIEFEYWLPNDQNLDGRSEFRHRVVTVIPEEEYIEKLTLVDPYSSPPPKTIPATTTSTVPPTTPTISTTTTTLASTTTTRVTSSSTSSTSSVPRTTTMTAKSKRPKRPPGGRGRRPKPSYCTPCKRPTSRRRHYCESDFVVHARVLSKSRVEGKRYRHDVQIVSVYKSDFKMMSREYVWVYSTCCPKLRPLREYLIMGRKRKMALGGAGQRGVWMTAGAGRNGTESSSRTQYQTRLVVDHMDYWHFWKRKYHGNMNKMANRMRCKSFPANVYADRDPEKRSAPSRRAGNS